jgi:hypothetical protein
VEKADAIAFERWAEYCRCWKRKTKPLHGALRSSQAFIQNGRVLIDSQNEFFLNLIRKNETAKADIKEAIFFRYPAPPYGIGPYDRSKYE